MAKDPKARTARAKKKVENKVETETTSTHQEQSQSQSSNKTSQSIVVPEAFFPRPNQRFRVSFGGFSCAPVVISHIRNDTLPCVSTRTSSISHLFGARSPRCTLFMIWLMNPVEKESFPFPEWRMFPWKSEGSQIVTSDASAWTSRKKVQRGAGLQTVTFMGPDWLMTDMLIRCSTG